jgi:hypothetical protein
MGDKQHGCFVRKQRKRDPDPSHTDITQIPLMLKDLIKRGKFKYALS